MNILLVSNKMPFPPRDGGSLATYNMLKGLAEEGNRVDLLAMNTAKHFSPLALRQPESVIVERFVSVYVDNRVKLSSLVTNLLVSSLPYNAGRYISVKFREALAEMLKSVKYNVVQLEGLYLAAYIDTIREYSDARIVYRAHNIEHLIWERVGLNNNNLLKKWYIKGQSGRIRRFEHGVINRYDMIAAITENDMETLNVMGNNKPCIVAHFGMYDKNSRTAATQGSDELCLQFIGALDWLPNIEALQWFSENVWKVLKNRYPDLRFYIAGRNAGRRLVRYLRKTEADFLGEIESAAEFLNTPGILVVPLLSGSGVRVRVIEAMYSAKPIIASSKAVSGISCEEGKHLLLADDPAGFIYCIEKLLHNPADASSMGRSAREFAVKTFNNREISGRLTDFYKKHTG